MLIAILPSCVPEQGSSGRKGSSTSSSSGGTTGTPTSPTFSGEANYFQDGAIKATSIFSLSIANTLDFYLRGEDVDTFIKDGSASTVQCLATKFSLSTEKSMLILALTPQSFYNFSTNTVEHYYLVSAQDENSNKNFCNKPGLISAFSGETFAFSTATVCTTCSDSQLQSDPTSVLTSDGFQITSIDVTNLYIKMATSNIVIPPSQACTSSPECKAKGFDCCSSGQCVNDKQIKNGVVTTDPDYIQAQQDILANPGAILNFPQYYHICSSDIPIEATPTPIPDPLDDAASRLETLQELYDCVNPSQGEMAFCTKSFENVQTLGTSSFYTSADDRNFNTTYSGGGTLPTHSIDKIVYAGETLFEDNVFNTTTVTIGPGGSLSGNDNLSDVQLITLTHTPKSSAPDDTLKIRYKIDGSCQKISSTLSKCYKIYTQGQNLTKIDDHFPASNDFLLPFYTDTNRTVKVEVDDTSKLLGTHWNLINTTPARVSFIGTDLQVYDTQVVKITFFVDTAINNVLQERQTALERIKDICNCADTDCNLEPVLNNSVIADYSCVYPQPDVPPAPLNQTVLLSSKTAPHRFFDNTGVPHDITDATTPEQEGVAFSYKKNNLLTPITEDGYVGFNEIYGSFNTDPSSAKPARGVSVTKGKTYDLFVDTGNFSTCFYCGTDYYSNVIKMFPQNFLFKGGGYQPDISSTDKFSSPTYRADDLLFGRACFLPVSMIPFTHDPSSDRQQQRMKRQNTQHFLFANGYQRDWFGFDYGSIIGSFDGVTWFAVGNQRRIKATTNKLFLAVNAYFQDQTIETTYTVTVADGSTVPASGSTITTNFQNDGAECQKHHVCNVDSDCISNLGWEYSCERVTSMTSRWPDFDANGLEIPAVERVINLVQEFGATDGGAKRCVYRARGAACFPDYEIADSNNSFNGTDKNGLHTCNDNSYCQPFVDGVSQAKFNSKIVRYGKSVKFQNASSDIAQSDADEFGFGARVLGRPFDWNGTETISTDNQSNLSNNQVNSICIPGRDPGNYTMKSGNSRIPTSEYQGDLVTGIGMTPTGSGSPHYLSSCSIFDASGDFFTHDSTNLAAGDNTRSNASLTKFAGQQAVSTNSMKILESMANITTLKVFEDEFIDGFYFQENRCLRSPGSVCFTDLDCAPSKVISEKFANIDANDISNWTTLNKYEIQFWQQPLVCSQEVEATNSTFDLKNNRCCRPINNTITIPTLIDQSTAGSLDASIPVFDNQNVPGQGTVSISDSERYSRMSTINDLMTDEASIHPALQTARKDSCNTCPSVTTLDYQYNSFAKTAERTCCSKNWVRNFHADNGGGHKWGPSKHQTVPKESFKCMNWLTCSGANCTNFQCADVDDPNCIAKATSNTEASEVFKFMNQLELLGIPQTRVFTEQHAEILCEVDPNNQALDGVAALIELPGIFSSSILNVTSTEYSDGGRNYYAGDDITNFDTSNIKMIFSAEDVSCCQPAGTVMQAGDDPNECCTGFINPTNNICQLPDYVNVSVFFNRYVSSSAKDLAPTLIDKESGYIKTPATVEQLACQMNVCASGTLARGVSLSNLKIQGDEGDDKFFKRFIDDKSDASNFSGLADLYDEGLKWNDDVYCVPSDLDLDGTKICL